MIRIEDLTIQYGKKKVVENVSLTANDGEVTVVLGKNGSGKSTIMRAIAGAHPYKGSICVNGVELKSLPGKTRATLISYMPQTLPCSELSVRELVLCGRTPYLSPFSFPRASDIELADGIIAQTGLSDIADSKLSSISGGERQRAFFAMLIAQDANVIILDEPTANLDTDFRQKVYAFIADARKNGRTVIVVMHHISEACRLADRICVLDKGRICFEGSSKEFCVSDIPPKVFGVSPIEYIGPNGEVATLFRPKQALP